MEKTYTMLVKNKPGCLDRIAGITRRFGWNIVSMAAAETPDTMVTRITISLECDKFCEMPDTTLSKLDFVLSMEVCNEDLYSFHEVMIARGDEKAFGEHLAKAVKVDKGEKYCTAWFLAADTNIWKLEAELVKNGIRTVRSGPMALAK